MPYQLCVLVHIIFSNCLGLLVDYQWISFICGVFPLVFLVAIFFVQDSPRYLLMKGKEAEASKALCWFRRKTSPQEVEDEMSIVSKSYLKLTLVIIKTEISKHICKLILLTICTICTVDFCECYDTNNLALHTPPLTRIGTSTKCV